MKPAKAIVLIALTTFGAIAFHGVISAGAETTVLHNWKCLPRVNGIYEDPDCLRITGTYGYERLGFSSTPEAVQSMQASEFELETSISGESTLIICTTESGTGTAWNPEPFETTNGEGTTTMTFAGCAVSKPSGCVIPGKKFTTNELSETLEEGKLGQGATFSPASGEIFAGVTFEKCSNPTFNKKYTIKGSDFGIANEESPLEFTNASSSLTFGGSEATLRGSIDQEDEEGNTVLIAP